MKKLITPLFFIHAIASFAQSAYLKGKISDSANKETIVGGNAVLDDSTGAVTDINGNYFIRTRPGKHKIEFRFTGYLSQTAEVDLKENDTLVLNKEMQSDSKQLDVVVVSAGRFEQRLGDVTVSMEVIRPSLIENKNTNNIETIMEQVPGVNMIDGQANIRGGSGFSYGAGSRVLLMVDEMPMLTADAGDVKWNFLPVENCEQIEVIKGASSALFGSSALNGVINFRTAYAKEEPETKLVFNGGYYDRPKRNALVWWQDGNPTFGGVNFYHAQKIRQLDLVIGANIFDDKGYRELETEQRYRLNVNLRYRFKKIKGLAVGVNANTIRTQGGLFLIWQNADSGAYRPSGGDLSHFTTYRTNIDPFITYHTENGARHSLRGRFFRTKNLNSTNQESTADVYYSEYQFQKRFKKDFTATTGLVCNYNEVHSGALYGTHFSTNASAYLQLDKRFFKKLSVSLGVRGEYFKTDTVETEEDVYLLLDESKVLAKKSKVKPVGRLGLNYQLAKATFLRASFGQGFRFPSVAERYIKTTASGLDLYPNDTLRPESGWSAEIGIKQGISLGEWKGFIDLAFFRTEYKDMMEFTFGQYGPLQYPFAGPTPTAQELGIGFMAQNVGNTRITGFEVSLMGQGKIGPVNMSALMGYTYINPVQVDFDPAVDTAKGTTYQNILKYRYEHTAKGDVEFGYKRFSLGGSCRYNSFMKNIDRFFVEPLSGIEGVKEYREKNKNGDLVFDARLSYQMNKMAKVGFIVNNVFNYEYVGRPADMQPPRTYAIQVTIKF
ncbi:MAG TPA: TonB-dependent receptor [Bacteroidia bacterium]|jgi:iron complex outermembrane receptor protein